MNSQQGKTILDTTVVPRHVETRVRIALNTLFDQDAALRGVKLARGGGYYLALECRDRQPRIQQAMNTLNEFRRLADEKGVDADAFLRARGGIPDFSKYDYLSIANTGHAQLVSVVEEKLQV